MLDQHAIENPVAPPRPAPPRRNWLRRFFLLEERIAAAGIQRFGASDPGYRELLLAVGASRCGEALFTVRPALRSEHATAGALTLFREALWWAFVAHALRQGNAQPSTPGDAWDAAVTHAATGLSALDEQTLTLARRTFVQRTFLNTPTISPEEARQELIALRVVTERAIARLKQATAVVRHLRLERVFRVLATLGALATLIVACVWGVQTYLRGPNLALHRPIATSSTLAGTPDSNDAVDGVTTLMGFHTQEEDQPWIQIDLGEAKLVREVVVYNAANYRSRAVPLVIELGTDGQHWTETKRRNEVFSKWTASFKPTSTRYVRLRAATRTYLHLNEIEVYARR